MNYTEAQFQRLPKWAQQEISRLESNETYYRNKLHAGPDGSNTFSENGERPLGDSPEIRFHVDGSPIRAKIVDGKLRLSTHGTIAVIPHLSNVLSVTGWRD